MKFKLALLWALFLYSPLTWAGSIERAAAISAFDEAEALIDRGQVDAACTKFQESYDLDPQLGSLLHLADCREKNEEVATAWSLFLTAAELAEKNSDERSQVAQDRASALAPQVSRARFKFEEPLPKGAKITRDGVDVPKALWKTDIPIDEGDHQIEVSAQGFESWRGSLKIEGRGTTVSLTIPPLRAGTDGTVAEADDGTGESKQRSLLARKWPALVAAGVGVAGGVVWGVFGAQSLSAKSDANSQCGAGNPCMDGDTDLRQKAWDAGNIATIGAIVTGVGFGAATILWLTLPGREKKSETATLAPQAQSHSISWKLGVQLGGARIAGTF